jgi:hypothetical protein
MMRLFIVEDDARDETMVGVNITSLTPAATTPVASTVLKSGQLVEDMIAGLVRNRLL